MITFYYGAGSPFTWRVWLALEHKALAYEMKVLSFSAGDLKKPEFIALNPRHKVPVIVDSSAGLEMVLYESAAILEYLDEAYPTSGRPLFPGHPADRATVRRMVCEADNYFSPIVNRLVRRVLQTEEADWKGEKIDRARIQCLTELEHWEKQIGGDYLAGALSAADFALYPMIALALRCESKKNDLALRSSMPEGISAWMQRMEALPYFSKTWPAHWN